MANLNTYTTQEAVNVLAQASSPAVPTTSVVGAPLPSQTDEFLVTAQAPQKTWCNGFDRVFASTLDPLWMNNIVTGSGMTVAQTGGSAVFTTGTTANAETIQRSLVTFDGSMTLRYSSTLSQRIANQQFFVEMVDVIGDNLVTVINSATSLTVTIPNNPFTAANVGQSMYVGNLTGTAAQIPGRYAIASVSGNDVTFTVSGFPATGAGTASLFGWNYHHVIYDGTTATSATFDSQRNGWNSGETTATINTTAAPGHVGVYGVTDGKTVFSDQLSASSTTLELTQRGSRVRNTPVDGTLLYLQIRVLNGSTSPASTTTWTVGFAEIDNFVLNQVSVNNVVPQSLNTALPVQVANTPASTITGGQTAHSAASTGNPLRVGGRVNTAVDTTLIAGDASDIFITSGGSLAVKPYSVPEVDWTYAAASGGITNTTTAVTIKTAAAAGVRNYITGLQIESDALGAATEVVIRDGAAGTVIWRTKIGTAGVTGGISVTFPTPLKGTAATLLEVATLTASVTGSVYINAQGFTAP